MGGFDDPGTTSLGDQALEQLRKELAAMKFDKTVMDEIVLLMHEHRDLTVEFVRAATKSGVKLAAVLGAMLAAKKATNVVVKQVIKSFIKAAGTGSLFSIVVDVAQGGLELAGYKKVGKQVGKGGNIISGAMIGAAVAGPPGAVIGAAGGFIIWGIGEVIGGVVDHYCTFELKTKTD